MTKTLARKSSENRGADLAIEVLDIIEAEIDRLEKAEAKAALRDGFYYAGEVHQKVLNKTNIWDQHTWATVDTDALPAGTEVKIIKIDDLIFDQSAMDSYGDQELAIALEAGITCGSTACFAGHVTLAAGDRFVVSGDHMKGAKLREIAGKTRNAKRFLGDEAFFIDDVVTTDGRLMALGRRAAELLELTDREATLLFSPTNSVDDLRRYVKYKRENRSFTTGRKKKVSA